MKGSEQAKEPARKIHCAGGSAKHDQALHQVYATPSSGPLACPPKKAPNSAYEQVFLFSRHDLLHHCPSRLQRGML